MTTKTTRKTTTTDYEPVHVCDTYSLMLREAPHGGPIRQHATFYQGNFITPATVDPDDLAHAIDIGMVKTVNVPMSDSAAATRPTRPADPELDSFDMPTRRTAFHKANQHCIVKTAPTGEQLVHRGGAIPPNADPAHLQHLVSIGAVTPVTSLI